MAQATAASPTADNRSCRFGYCSTLTLGIRPIIFFSIGECYEKVHPLFASFSSISHSKPVLGLSFAKYELKMVTGGRDFLALAPDNKVAQEQAFIHPWDTLDLCLRVQGGPRGVTVGLVKG